MFPKIKLIHFISIVVALSAAFLLTGCGGGGVLNVSPFAALDQPTKKISVDSFRATSQVSPKDGSVIQSSGFGGLELTNINSLEVEVTRADGPFTIKLNNQKLFSTDDPGVTTVPINSTNTPGWADDTVENNAFVYSTLPISGESRIGSTQIGKGTAHFWLARDWSTLTYENSPNHFTKGTATNYMAYGIWLYVPASGNSYETGAFMYGKDPFARSNIAPLTGNATYEGGAGGLFSTKSNTSAKIIPWEADVSLTAAFGNSTNFGSISGQVSGITIGSTETPLAGSLTLGSAVISNASGSKDGGFFSGNVSGTVDGKSFTGKWGGQFYRDQQYSSPYPSNAAGTLGATNTTGTIISNFLGIFDGSWQLPQ